MHCNYGVRNYLDLVFVWRMKCLRNWDRNLTKASIDVKVKWKLVPSWLLHRHFTSAHKSWWKSDITAVIHTHLHSERKWILESTFVIECLATEYISNYRIPGKTFLVGKVKSYFILCFFIQCISNVWKCLTSAS